LTSSLITVSCFTHNKISRSSMNLWVKLKIRCNNTRRTGWTMSRILVS
jgi:hypothetical protein